MGWTTALTQEPLPPLKQTLELSDANIGSCLLNNSNLGFCLDVTAKNPTKLMILVMRGFGVVGGRVRIWGCMDFNQIN